jgi:type IV secretion system protein VirB9
MIRSFVIALTAATGLAGAAAAIEYPPPGRDDPNMRTAAYKPGQRYLIVGVLRHETTIKFGKTEIVARVSFGDADVWEGQKAEGQRAPKNSITIWPLRVDLTNMVVTTELPDGSENTYHFAMLAHDPAKLPPSSAACTPALLAALPDCASLQAEDPSAIYGLTFTYPADEKAAAVVAFRQARQNVDTNKAIDRLKVDFFYGERNWRYVAMGDRRIAPTEISDNKWMTGLRYPGTLSMPAVFWLGPDGSERSIVFERLDDVAIAKVRARVFRVRQGLSVLDLYNCDGLPSEVCFAAAKDVTAFAAIPFADTGPDPRTGTTTPNVLRIISRDEK